MVSLRVEPADVELATTSGSPASQDFTAIATFSDGQEGKLDLVSWDLSNASVGSLDSRGHYKSVDTNGGEATITATFLDNVATATLRLTHSATYIEEGVDEAGAAALGAVAEGEAGLNILYPFENTTVPRNLEGLEVNWTGNQGKDIIRLHFESSLESVDVYTTGAQWIVPVDVWETVSATNRKGSLTLQVFGASWDGTTLGTVKQSDPVNVTVNRFDASGSVLYWSTADQSINRIPAGTTESSRFYPTSSGSGLCYGCHEISEGRQWMVVTRDGVDGTYQVVDVQDPANPTVVFDVVDTQRMTFHTLSPDGTRVLGCRDGSLVVYDLATNRFLATVTPDGYKYTHPNWSPDGTKIVATRITGTLYSDMSSFGGEVVLMSWDGSALGTPEVVAPSEAGISYYYPAFSPDGAWIVYNRSSGDTYADDDAELWLVPASGGTAMRLNNANGSGEVRNSLARWAPLPDDDVLWLAFSSRQSRQGGVAASSQIWITAIDPEIAATGADPSSAPYWLPGQASSSDNHLPVWWSQ